MSLLLPAMLFKNEEAHFNTPLSPLGLLWVKLGLFAICFAGSVSVAGSIPHKTPICIEIAAVRGNVSVPSSFDEVWKSQGANVQSGLGQFSLEVSQSYKRARELDGFSVHLSEELGRRLARGDSHPRFLKLLGFWEETIDGKLFLRPPADLRAVFEGYYNYMEDAVSLGLVAIDEIVYPSLRFLKRQGKLLANKPPYVVVVRPGIDRWPDPT